MLFSAVAGLSETVALLLVRATRPPSSCSVERSPVRTRIRPGELLCTTGRVAHGFSEGRVGGSETVAKATVSAQLHTRQIPSLRAG